MRLEVVHGDAFEVLAELAPGSVSAVVTDPPYGLEFMGREWDRFREDDALTRRHRGDRAGEHGETRSDGDERGAFGRVAYGGGARPTTHRCQGCGKRDQFRQPHACSEGTPWRKELIDPHAAPPSMLAFQSWCREWARLAYRALKPGGYVLAFGGSRTSHRMVCGVEDAGFEVRDGLQWLYGNGFPKSLDVSKAIDAAAGAEREPGVQGRYAARRPRDEVEAVNAYHDGVGDAASALVSAPATPEAAEWEGWGTALKPAHEPIVLARKPLAGTVAATVLEHGTGALNVDGCRIAMSDEDRQKIDNMGGFGREDWTRPDGTLRSVYSTADGGSLAQRDTKAHDAGRWPANVLMDEAAAALLDAQAGEPVSRFFYVAKADTAERHAGLAVPSLFTPEGAPELNDHPTVKPIDVMRWLVRLVTPPGGLVLDPFAGSGTTGIACALEGFDFLGVEQDADSVAIARARIAHWSNGLAEVTTHGG